MLACDRSPSCSDLLCLQAGQKATTCNGFAGAMVSAASLKDLDECTPLDMNTVSNTADLQSMFDFEASGAYLRQSIVQSVERKENLPPLSTRKSTGLCADAASDCSAHGAARSV